MKNNDWACQVSGIVITLCRRKVDPNLRKLEKTRLFFELGVNREQLILFILSIIVTPVTRQIFKVTIFYDCLQSKRNKEHSTFSSITLKAITFTFRKKIISHFLFIFNFLMRKKLQKRTLFPDLMKFTLHEITRFTNGRCSNNKLPIPQS